MIFKKTKKEEDLLGSGPFSRDGRVTGNKHILLLGLNKNFHEDVGQSVEDRSSSSGLDPSMRTPC